jgi:NitT/TauT family transport system substrate-binding protein
MSFRRFWKLIAATIVVLATSCANASDSKPARVRVGVLEFGSTNWELDVIQNHGLAGKHGVDLIIVPLASADGSAVALSGGAVDIIVSDWIWVSRQRTQSNLYTFVPYSYAVGSLLVKNDSPYRQLSDLKGKKLGVAGGANDKTWLLLRAYARKNLNVDLTRFVKPVYAAPPLLNELAMRDEIDGALNYWHYAARLQASGMRTLITMPEILHGLEIEKQIPLIGWVFHEEWAAANPDAVKGFLKASYEAKAILAHSDAEWDRLKPRMRAENDLIFTTLRSEFRKGIPRCSDRDTTKSVMAVFKILAETGGKQLVGHSTNLAPGTFWSGFQLPEC